MTKDIAKRGSTDVAAMNAANPIGGMMIDLLNRADTPEMLTAATATMKELIEAYNQQEDRQAMRDFATDFAALQADIPTLVARKEVRTKSGDLKYKCKPHAEIIEEVKPILVRHGFSIFTDTRWEENRGVATIELLHKGGHSKKSEFAVMRSGPPGDNPSEADEATMTRAMRRCLQSVLNIAVAPGDDEDAAYVGSPITADQAAELKSRVEKCGADVAAFLKYAGADSFESIMSSRLASLESALASKERAAAKPNPVDDVDIPEPPDDIKGGLFNEKKGGK